MYYLGIEIGGTKLQIGAGPGDGTLLGLWRQTVDVAAGPEGIRRQIQAGVPALLAQTRMDRAHFRGIGIGFGGPVDDATRTIIKSHQIEGWDGFPLADWISELVDLPAALGNDADVGGLAEALFGAGKGLSPVFYITIGSGIGGGLIINGEIYRGCGRGAAEFGHLRVPTNTGGVGLRWVPLEEVASGWAIQERARNIASTEAGASLLSCVDKRAEQLTAQDMAWAAERGDTTAQAILDHACDYLAQALCNVIALLCPRRIVIGGGVSLMGEALLFQPLRALVRERVFRPFAGLTEIVPAALGQEVVVHGALALARRSLGE